MCTQKTIIFVYNVQNFFSDNPPKKPLNWRNFIKHLAMTFI